MLHIQKSDFIIRFVAIANQMLKRFLLMGGAILT